ncbi:MAG: two-component regulator propeller domain-containing protein [Vicingaceae bacterium]
MRITLFLGILLLHLAAICQNAELGIGQWREHVPYSKANSISAGNGMVYCGSEAAFLAYNTNSKELKRYTTITGLSDVGIELLKLNKLTNSLVVAYRNGNLDIVEGGRITNIAFIKDANIIGDKGIYNIRFEGAIAYLSCGFGIVVLDLRRKEIKDTYFIAKDSKPLKINDVFVSIGENTLVVAAENGIYRGNLDNNLSDFNSWVRDTNLPANEFLLVDSFAGYEMYLMATPVFDSNIVYGKQGSTFGIISQLGSSGINDWVRDGKQLIVSRYYSVQVLDEAFDQITLLYEYDGGRSMQPAQTAFDGFSYWVADQINGFGRFYSWGGTELLTPNGPNAISLNNISINEGILWASAGLLDPDFRSSTNPPDFNQYSALSWSGFNQSNYALLSGSYGFVKIKINPFDPTQVFSGSWDRGLLELKDGVPTVIYDHTNKSTLGHTLSAVDAGNMDQTRIGGLDFDDEGNLWITNSEVPNALSVKTVDGDWYTYNLSAYVNSFTIVGEVLVAENGYKWILLNRNKEIIIFDDAGTPEFLADDRLMALTGQEGSGDIPGDRINCIAQDRSGAIWIGTNEGPAVYYNPSSVFESTNDFQRIFVQQDGQTQILLETENIRSIAVDGANRKWIGTGNSGAYLMSEDGATQINHFTFQNSPLFSDNISDIEINNTNGEVFFSTDAGLISYKGSATEGGDDFKDVQVYPNPVPQGYSGVVAIKGLAQNANVKITDIGGNLVFETTANGGQAVWNGNSISGRKASNGVYLVFANDLSGEFHQAVKFLYLAN